MVPPADQLSGREVKSSSLAVMGLISHEASKEQYPLLMKQTEQAQTEQAHCGLVN